MAVDEMDIKLEVILNSLKGLVFVIDFQGKIIQANNRAAELLGISEFKIKEINLGNILDKNYMLDLSRAINDISKDRDQIKEFIFSLTIKERIHLFKGSISLLLEESDKVFLLQSEEIIEDKGNRSLLQFPFPEPKLHNITYAFFNHETEFVKTITDSATTALIMMNSKGQVEYLNPAAEKMIGYSSLEMIGKILHDVVHFKHPDGSSYDLHDCKIRKSILEEEIPLKNHEDIFIRKDGTFFPVLCSSSPIIKDGKLSAVVLEVIDLTEKKRSDDALEESRTRLKLALDAGSIGIWERDLKNDLVYCDQGFAKMYSIPPELAEHGAPVSAYFNAIPEDDLLIVEKSIENSIVTGQPFQLEHRVIQPDNTYKWVMVRGNSKRNPVTGKAIKITGVILDISDRKNYELKLKESEAKFRQIVESNIVGIMFWNLEGKITEANDAFLKMLGYTQAELDVLDWSKLTPPDWVKADQFAIQELISTGIDTPYEKQFYHKNGHKVDVFLGAAFFPGSKTDGFSYVVDISDRKKAESDLKESEAKFRVLADTMPQMIWSTRPDGYHDYYNQRWYDFVGKPANETEGEQWNDQFHKDDQERAWKVWKHSLATGEPYEIEYRLRHHSGEYKWVLGRALPIRNNKGEIIRWFGTCTDIQKQKDTEAALKQSEEQWRDAANKLTKINNDLDNFIYTASHDLKAPISNIEGLIMALDESLSNKADDEDRGLLELINQSLNRFKNTIKDLTEVSKVQKEALDDIDSIHYQEILEEIKADLSPMIKSHHATINEDIKEYSIQFSRKNVRSIIYNLVSNAIKYSHPDRKPVIDIKTFREGGCIVLSVKDNGLGISPEQKHKLFGMFKRIHSHVEGTGIGLYIVKRMVDNAGGKIEVNSVEGLGTEFRVYFRAKVKSKNSNN